MEKRKPPKQNRCCECNKLLGVGNPGNIIIKCPRCGKFNNFQVKNIIVSKRL